MADLFADTSGLLALLDRDQPSHGSARRSVTELARAGGRLVTTDGVLMELVALATIRSRLPRPALLAILRDLRSSWLVEILPLGPDTLEAAWSLLFARPDKTWSLVDCASFVVMQQRGLTDALTSDHHFTQAGFTALLAG